MKEVTKYESDSGRPFDTPEEAIREDKRHKLVCLLYDDDSLYWREISPEDVADFLLANKDQVKEILS